LLQVLDATLLAKIVQHRESVAAAAGPSSMSAHHVRVLMEDTVCKRGIMDIVLDLVNAVFDGDAELLPVLLAARLIALNKDPEEVLAIRPVAVGEEIVKLAAEYGLELVGLDAIAKYLPVIQFGQGMAGGLEAARHLIQGMLEASELSYLVLADIANAFNTRSREEMLEALYACEDLGPLFRIATLLYGNVSPLVIYDRNQAVEVLASVFGSRQGCVLGSLLFNLAVQPHYEATADAFPQLKLVAIHDGVHIAGVFNPADPTEGLRALRHIADRLRAGGSVMNPAKTIFFWPHSTPMPAVVRAEALALGLKIVEGGTVKMAGSFVGTDVEAMTSAVLREATSQAALLDRMVGLPLQTQSLLLRVCSLPKIGHLIRAMDPDVSGPGARVFDQATLRRFISLTPWAQPPSIPFPSQALNQVTLPTQLGGMGIRPQERTSFAAYYASQSLSAPRTARFFQDNPHLPIVQSIERARAMLERQGVVDIDGCFPPTVLEMLATHSLPGLDPPARLQRALVAAIEQRIGLQLFLDSPPSVQARLMSLSNPSALAFLNAIPDRPGTCMDDTAFSHALAFVLDLPFVDLPPECPLCPRTPGTLPTLLGGSLSHLTSCVSNRRTGQNNRHNNVVRAITESIKSLPSPGVSVSMEVAYDFVDDQKLVRVRNVADIDIVADEHYVCDVSIVNPTAASFVGPASLHALAAAENREGQKVAKYRAFCRAFPRAHFVPLVFESYGAIGEAARQFLHDLAEMMVDTADSHGCDHAGFGDRLVEDTSVAIHRHNGHMIARAAQAIRAHNVEAARRARADEATRAAALRVLADAAAAASAASASSRAMYAHGGGHT
jgi:hypothetical protein